MKLLNIDKSTTFGVLTYVSVFFITKCVRATGIPEIEAFPSCARVLKVYLS